MNSHEVFIHIHQGCFAGTGAIVRLPQCQWSKPDGYGKISQCITTTKHSKAKTVCIFLGIYCMLSLATSIQGIPHHNTLSSKPPNYHDSFLARWSLMSVIMILWSISMLTEDCQGPFHKQSMSSKWKFCKIEFHSFLIIYCPIELQFWTCHDSYAVRACAKLWLNCVIDLRRVKIYLIEFRSWSHLCLLDNTPTRSDLHLFRSSNFLTSGPKAFNQTPWGIYTRHLSDKNKPYYANLSINCMFSTILIVWTYHMNSHESHIFPMLR